MSERGEGNQDRSEALAQHIVLKYLDEAAEKDSFYSLGIELGLRDRIDITSMHYSMAIRFARRDIYNSQLIRRMPIRNMSLRSGLARISLGLADKIENYELGLASLDQQYQVHVENNYKKDPHRPRTIDLAVNDLIARSTIQKGQFVTIRPEIEILVPWRDRWRKRLGSDFS